MLIALALLAMQALPGSIDTIPASGARAPALRAWRTERPPRIDGRLDEPAWTDAPVASAFSQRNPQEGAAATQRTEVRVLYDHAALYIGARLFETAPRAMRSVLMRRDGTTPSDQFTVILDSEHDHQSAMRFTVNPRGVRADALLSGDSEEGDPTWDPVWHVATHVDGEGWTAEMRIPLSQLRFRGGDHGGEWGLNFERYLASRQESDSYVPLRRAENGYVSRFAHLVGLEDLRTPHALDVTPYLSGQLASRPVGPEAVPARHVTTRPRGGFDLRYGLASNVTFVATANPDFGQVEADPATLNLSEFETVLEERRPFFQEGGPVFAFGRATGSRPATAPQFFYSRRIGGAPTLSPDAAAALGDAVDSLRSPYVESPTSTAILGAAKLTGSLAHGLSFGVLHAETRREFASVTGAPSTGPSSGGPLRQLLEPRGHYSVARVRQDLREGATSLGLIATSVMRDLESPRLDSAFAARAYAGGVDWRHRWDRRRFGFDGWLGWSYVGGPPVSVTQVQRSPAHYLQRPDRRGMQLDSSRTSLAGSAGAARLGYDGPSGVSVSLDGTATSPGFELNALGYLAGTDERSVTATVGWQQPRPSPHLQSYGVSAYGAQTWTGNDGRLGQTIGVTAFGYAQRGWGGTASLDRALRGVSTTAARGGPLVVTGARTTLSASVLTDPRRALALVGYGHHGTGEFGDRSTEVGASLTWRPTATVQLSLDPTLTRTRDAAAYVADVPDTLAATTFGRRYVFAALDQRSAGVAFRSDLAFTPDLGLQLYVQPFSAAARYADLGELRRPRSFEFGRYGVAAASTAARDRAGAYEIDPDGAGPAAPFVVADPDFAFRSLTGNAVLRWEYRPGATAYLVWTQRRNGSGQPAAFRVGDLRAAFDRAPENVLLLKVSARWGR